MSHINVILKEKSRSTDIEQIFLKAIESAKNLVVFSFSHYAKNILDSRSMRFHWQIITIGYIVYNHIIYMYIYIERSATLATPSLRM